MVTKLRENEEAIMKTDLPPLKNKLSIAKILSEEKHAELDKIPKPAVKSEAKARDLASKQLKHEQVLRTIAKLEQEFPECFNLSEPKPLKPAILDELYQIPDFMEGISKSVAKDAIKIYISKTPYQNALIKYEWHYDLQGNPCGHIDRLQKAAAQEWLNKRSQIKI